MSSSRPKGSVLKWQKTCHSTAKTLLLQPCKNYVHTPSNYRTMTCQVGLPFFLIHPVVMFYVLTHMQLSCSIVKPYSILLECRGKKGLYLGGGGRERRGYIWVGGKGKEGVIFWAGGGGGGKKGFIFGGRCCVISKVIAPSLFEYCK